MLNFEMNLKRVNDKYYVNNIEVSKDEYIDAVTVLDNYLEEQDNKDMNERNIRDFDISDFNIPMLDPVFIADNVKYNLLNTIVSFCKWLY